MDKIDGALCSQRSPEWQVERMVDDILRICAEADSAYRLSKTLKTLWVVVIIISGQLYPDSPNQGTLLKFVRTLRKRDGEIKEGYQVSKHLHTECGKCKYNQD